MFALVDKPCCFCDCCIQHSNIQSVMENSILYVSSTSSTSLKIVTIVPYYKCKFCRLYFVVILQLVSYGVYQHLKFLDYLFV
jgi:hypothetical protein